MCDLHDSFLQQIKYDQLFEPLPCCRAISSVQQSLFLYILLRISTSGEELRPRLFETIIKRLVLLLFLDHIPARNISDVTELVGMLSFTADISWAALSVSLSGGE